ncbi:nuclear transport factor 2 family protein [Actinomadura algeriensis]|uniref:Ketosteroid isomerase-like protein n=1 Tax=Actinomadura algeriensis TaxID=1679523 RepID=A0ABR9K311_9ACTN|nr:nuclear transport factor 2 family protein [Actinomadura algeriensis]MBE1537103.1 ketosteroid isomerase-like protein [Actinomadura algeriensis]
MNSEQPDDRTGTGPRAVELVTEMARRFRAGDHEGAFALLHPRFRIQQPASLPHGGWYDGAAGMAEMGTAFARHWSRTIGEPRVLDCGDSAVQITEQTWTAAATGRSATVDVVELFAVADGLISEIRVFQQDTHALLATLDPDGR